MRLNDEEQDVVADKSGPVARQALQHQLKVGEWLAINSAAAVFVVVGF